MQIRNKTALLLCISGLTVSMGGSFAQASTVSASSQTSWTVTAGIGEDNDFEIYHANGDEYWEPALWFRDANGSSVTLSSSTTTYGSCSSWASYWAVCDMTGIPLADALDSTDITVDTRDGDDEAMIQAQGASSGALIQRATLFGGNGNDELSVAYGDEANDATATLNGGGGDDTLIFSDTSRGTASSTIVGGSGVDTVQGSSYGNDLIRTADGEADTINCQGSTDADVLIADRFDTYSNCETVRVTL